jgi:hypothetical protein
MTEVKLNHYDRALNRITPSNSNTSTIKRVSNEDLPEIDRDEKIEEDEKLYLDLSRVSLSKNEDGARKDSNSQLQASI